jgi:drug/metabolite transporter (DMT)-like permease
LKPELKERLHFGPLNALGAALLFGASTPFAKLFLRDSDSVMLAGLLYAGSGIGLTILWFFRFRQSRDSLLGLRQVEVFPLVGSILFGGVTGPILLMFGLRQVNASAASLLLNLESAFTALIACLVFHERYGKRLVFGLILILLGGGILSGSDSGFSGAPLGMVAVAGAALCWAIDNNFAKKVTSLEAGVFAGMKGLVAGAVNIFLATLLHQAFPAMKTGFAILMIGFAGYGLSLVLFILSLRKLGAARTSAYFSTAPFMGGLLAILFLKEPFNRTLGVAGLFMAVGVYLHLTEHRSPEKSCAVPT